jgi:murein DD-endopeptidase MepM/ murein hydrolase activator NlpD
MRFSALWLCLLILVLGVGVIIVAPQRSLADATSTIQDQISANNQQINSLQSQIAQYQTQLNSLGAQKQTLQSALKSIQVTQEKTAAEQKLTQSQIAQAALEIQNLGGQITTKQQAITLDKAAVGASIREIASTDDIPVIAAVISSDTLTQAWQDISTITELNEALSSSVQTLSGDQQQLAAKQTDVSNTKSQLSTLNTTLTAQQGQLNATAQAKKQLIAQTNSQETSYQQLIAQKKAQETQFENELTALESQLKNVNPSQIPKVGNGILAWPFSDAVMATCPGKASALGNPYCITQYFGNTPFATANAAIYNNMGHDGLDIGVPIGTPVQAALSGTVLATGNTDLAHSSSGAQCLSFGKWVMLKHNNGLNTLYAHLSVISVSAGQSVNTGDVVGYSGMTGYATGPHLHFGVYASAGVKITSLNNFRGDATTPCANATLPVAPADAYLNPLSYLP